MLLRSFYYYTRSIRRNSINFAQNVDLSIPIDKVVLEDYSAGSRTVFGYIVVVL